MSSQNGSKEFNQNCKMFYLLLYEFLILNINWMNIGLPKNVLFEVVWVDCKRGEDELFKNGIREKTVE